MRKLLQVIVCGLAAASLGAIAADDKKSNEADTKASAGTSADVKTDKKAKGKTRDEHGRQPAAGATAESKAEVKAGSDTKAEAAPAPAPEKVETDKK